MDGLDAVRVLNLVHTSARQWLFTRHSYLCDVHDKIAVLLDFRQWRPIIDGSSYVPCKPIRAENGIIDKRSGYIAIAPDA